MTKPRPDAPHGPPATQRPCPVAALAAEWAILDDQITGTWQQDDADRSLTLAMDIRRNATIAEALTIPPGSATGAAFQAYAVGLSIAIANDPTTPPADRSRHLTQAAEGARHLARYLTTVQMTERR